MHPDRSSFECVIGEFEDAWMGGKPPSLNSFLEHVADVGSRPELLSELVFVDLEFRWRASANQPDAGWLLERYVQEIPELGPLGSLPIDFIAEECRARRRWGDSPDPDSYMKRFPDREAEVAAAISRIDQELRHEFDRCPQPQPEPHGSGRAPVSPLDSNQDLNLRFDDYVLDQMIGAGQMGRVYRARKNDSEVPVAVKFLRKSFCRDRSAVERFLTEARHMIRLEHPGIIRVHGVGSTPGGGYFFAMDLLPGPDLSKVIQQALPSIQDAVSWTIQACQAIHHSHQFGIVHCDLKPGNLILNDHRSVLVTDFGLAQMLSDETRANDRIAGTAPFMAPEQVSGYWGSVGPQTDVYGLGAVLYALLTGNAPHSGRMLTDTLARVVSGIQPVSVEELRREVRHDLSVIVHKCLAKRPDDRYRSASEFEDALREIGLCGSSS